MFSVELLERDFIFACICMLFDFALFISNSFDFVADCASPYYGPNCEHVCNYCEGRRCDRFGSCITNCKQPESCSAGKNCLAAVTP